MKLTYEKNVYLIVCSALLILQACAPMSSGLSITSNENALDSASQPANVKWQASTRTGVTASFQEAPLAINYNNCSHLYAVQPGDSLADVAQVSATTEEFVLSRNDLDSADDIYPGLVLCLENGSGIIPPTGGERSGVEVTDVSTNQTVTVRGVNFPGGAAMNVYMLQLGISDPNTVNLGSITVPAGGTFERTFQIPAPLRPYRDLIIRFRNPSENVTASTTFLNANVDRVTPDECAEYYTVRSGDVLGTIAQEINVSVRTMIELNNLADANVIFPGQMLCVELR